MTGYQVRRIRETIGVDPFAWAALLGVHVSTVYRWEKSDHDIRIDPLQLALLEKIRMSIRRHPAIKLAIVNGLVAGGTLRALRDVLEIVLQ